jgi:hypothetical protein
MGYGQNGQRIAVRFPAGARGFPLLNSVQIGSGARPVSYPTGTVSSFLGGKAAKADHSSPSSVEIKEWWSYAAALPYVFTAWCLMKRRENFTNSSNQQISAWRVRA